MNRIAIIGAGSLGQQIAYYAISNGYHITGFFDDFETQKKVSGIDLLGRLDLIDKMSSCFDELVLAIGYKHFRERKTIFESMNKRYRFATIIDKSALIDPSVVIGEGSIVFPGVLLDKGVKVGKNVLLNIAVTIAHDTVIGSHSFLSPRVAVAGYCQIGESNFLGINSSVIDNRHTACRVQVGAGAVVTNNLSESGLYIGIPAILKRKLDE